VSVRIGHGQATAAAFGYRDVAAVQTWLVELLETAAA
jgi:hypothetical protein